jgi:hypothetical protein
MQAAGAKRADEPGARPRDRIRGRELRQRLITFFLQRENPACATEIISELGIPAPAVEPALRALVAEGRVVAGPLDPNRPGPQFFWAAWWEAAAASGAAAARRAAVRTVAPKPRRLDIESDAVTSFAHYVTEQYTPPADKRLLVFFQCSVRRPFSTAPSHASMRRAVSTATGYDPAKQFTRCPVHVVVLASRIGPVPYELEDVYPANVRCGGVKHFSPSEYARVRPILAQRVAGYLAAHRTHYDRVAAFADGRYAEVMRDAQTAAGIAFPVFPDLAGPRVARVGRSIPRTYWQTCWIQLCFEIMGWLPPAAREAAEGRLREMGMEMSDGRGAAGNGRPGSAAKRGRRRRGGPKVDG